MSLHRLSRVLCLGLGVLSACSQESGNDVVLVGPGDKADGIATAAPLYACRIQMGESSNAWFRQDTLICKTESTQFTPHLYVSNKQGFPLTDVLLSTEETRIQVQGDAYPIKLFSATNLFTDQFGLQESGGVEHGFTIDDPTKWSAFQGPQMPFEIWDVDITGVYEAFLQFEPYTVAPSSGAKFTMPGGDRLDIRPMSNHLSSGETIHVQFLVAPGTTSLAAFFETSGGKVTTSITGPGTYELIDTGLVVKKKDEPAAPLTTGSDLIACALTQDPTASICNVVSRPGVTLMTAFVDAHGMRYVLPLDGTAFTVSDTTDLVGTVQIANGIAGLDNAASKPITGAMEFTDGAAVLRAPFDLIHVHATFNDDFLGIIDVLGHTVNFSQPIGGTSRAMSDVSLYLMNDVHDVWLAATTGTQHVIAKVTVAGTNGSLKEQNDVAIRSGEYVIDAQGFAAAQ